VKGIPRLAATFLLTAATVSSQEDSRGSRRQWYRVPSPVASRWTTTFFLNAREGWALGWDGEVVGTADGGRTWQLIRRKDEAARHSMYFGYMFFQDRRTGWIGAREIICDLAGPGMLHAWKTIDGGETWVEVGVPLHGEARKLQDPVSFETVQGDRWQRICGGPVYVGKIESPHLGIASRHPGLADHKDLEKPEFRDVCFQSSKLGCLIGHDTRGAIVLRTEDGGKTWVRQGIGAFKALCPSRVCMSGEQDVWVTAGPRILATHDGGTTWREEWAGGLDQNLEEIRFLEPFVGVAVGYGGTLLRYSK
jgi:photosystem II stability/assembly factor-like uncharacterized protein